MYIVPVVDTCNFDFLVSIMKTTATVALNEPCTLFATNMPA